MRRELLMRCSCGSEIFSLISYVDDPFDEDEHWIEIVMTYRPRGLRHRIAAFRGRYAQAVVMEEADRQRLREFLAEGTS